MVESIAVKELSEELNWISQTFISSVSGVVLLKDTLPLILLASTVIDAVPAHPLVEPVTIYVVVVVGMRLVDAHVGQESPVVGDQENVEAPEAVSVTSPPQAEVEVAVTVGVATTVMVISELFTVVGTAQVASLVIWT